METLIQDLRYGIRMLLQKPGFTAVAVLTLAVGIGANTAIFTLIDAVLLRDLPIEDPDRVVALYTSDFSSGLYGGSSFPDYVDYRDQAESFADLAAVRGFAPMNISTGGESERVVGALVTGNFFELLGVRPLVGRFFQPDEDRTLGASPVAVLSYDFWQRSFGGDRGVAGSDIILNGQRFTIVGVAPGGFPGTNLFSSPALWVPMSMLEQAQPRLAGRDLINSRGSRWLGVVGRLADGAALEEAQAEVTAIAAQLAQAFPNTNLGTLREPDKPRPITLVPVNVAAVGPGAWEFAGRVAQLLMIVVGFVLLIACANVANLLLSRATGRQREVAVRLAMGAGRGRLIRQLLTESTVIALVGGLAGLILAMWLRNLLVAIDLPGPLAMQLMLPDLDLNGTVLAFCLGLSLLTGVVFGLAPALQSTKPDLVPTLKETEGPITRSSRRLALRNLLVVVQVALSLVLLIGAGLFVRSLQRALEVDPGFDSGNVLLANADLSLSRYPPARGTNFYRQLLEGVRALPGVRAASLAMVVPVDPSGSRRTVSIEGYTPEPREDMELNFNIVGTDYFRAIGAGVRQGRSFTDQDSEFSQPVVMINETFARRYWPGEDPTGKGIRFAGPAGQVSEVIGVVQDGKYRSMREEPMPYMYLPLDQNYVPRVTLLVRTDNEPLSQLAAVRSEIQGLDPNLPIFAIRTLEDQQDSALVGERAGAILLGAFALVALLLASVGIYGVVSYAVEHRTHEIGVRMALGAKAPDVLKMVAAQGMVLVVVGVVLGLLGALSLTRAVAALLYEVSPTDAAAFAAAPLILASVALAACLLPARRATRVEPVIALRYE